MSNYYTLMALPTTDGGKELENKYGLDTCLRRSTNCLGPVV